MNVDFNKELSKQYFIINGQKICFFGWCLSYDIHYRQIYKIQSSLKDGQYLSIIKPQQIPEANLRNQVEIFLTEYMDLMANWDPTGQKARIPQMSKKDFYYNMFLPHISKIHTRWASYKYFQKIWCSSFKHIHMTSKQRFSICQDCQDFNDKIHNVSLIFSKNCYSC